MSDGYHPITGVDHFALGKRHATAATRNAPTRTEGAVAGRVSKLYRELERAAPFRFAQG